jgi:hypothetical protein
MFISVPDRIRIQPKVSGPYGSGSGSGSGTLVSGENREADQYTCLGKSRSGWKKRVRQGKVSVSRKGILKIKDIDHREAGRYTCLGKRGEQGGGPVHVPR